MKADAVVAERLSAQLLAGRPASDPVAVTRRLLAVQGQDQRGARLAIRVRSSGRAGLTAIASELHEREDGLLELARRRATATATARLPGPRLLGAYDPVLLGWRSRAPLLDANEPIVTVNGLFRPFALVRGRAAATWSFTAGAVVLKPFAPLARSDERALLEDAEDVVRYLAAAPSS